MDTKYDIIIIGSGIGGLSSGLLLSKVFNKKVLILEKHFIAGGQTHDFMRTYNGKKYQWDVGVHYVGGAGKNGSLSNLFNLISNKKIEWDYMGDVYDVVFIGDNKYNMLAGKENFRKQLKEYFPNEKTAIDKYLRLIGKVSLISNAFFIVSRLYVLPKVRLNSIVSLKSLGCCKIR